jgi:hypothetical protein
MNELKVGGWVVLHHLLLNERLHEPTMKEKGSRPKARLETKSKKNALSRRGMGGEGGAKKKERRKVVVKKVAQREGGL